MRRPQFLVTTALLFLCASCAAAQSNGAIVEEAACAPNATGTYQEYIEAFKRGYAEEIEAARQEGFRMEPPANLTKHLLGKEEFERRTPRRCDAGSLRSLLGAKGKRADFNDAGWRGLARRHESGSCVRTKVTGIWQDLRTHHLCGRRSCCILKSRRQRQTNRRVVQKVYEVRNLRTP